MSSDNPTDHDPDEDFEEIRDIDAEKEIYLREFLARQRELQRKSLTAMANLASANTELILRSGLNEVAAKRTKTTTSTSTNDVAKDLLAQRINGNEQIVEKIMRAIDIDV